MKSVKTDRTDLLTEGRGATHEIQPTKVFSEAYRNTSWPYA